MMSSPDTQMTKIRSKDSLLKRASSKVKKMLSVRTQSYKQMQTPTKHRRSNSSDVEDDESQDAVAPLNSKSPNTLSKPSPHRRRFLRAQRLSGSDADFAPIVKSPSAKALKILGVTKEEVKGSYGSCKRQGRHKKRKSTSGELFDEFLAENATPECTTNSDSKTSGPESEDAKMRLKSLEKLMVSNLNKKGYHARTRSGTVATGVQGRLHRRVASRIDLETLLGSQPGVDSFMQHLKNEYSQENLEFWLAVKQFREDPTHKRASELYNQFVKQGADTEINIPYNIRERVEADMKVWAGSSQVSRTIFDEAQREILILMQRDSLPRYQNSNLFRSFRSGSTSF
jgi:regulator of G-protein signaling